MTNSETRTYPRKVLRAKTVDVSLGGLCLMVPEQLPVGQKCNIGFEAPLNGKMVRIFAVAKVAYSILSGTDGFRTGLQFTEIDAANDKLLAEVMI